MGNISGRCEIEKVILCGERGGVSRQEGQQETQEDVCNLI